MRKIELATGHSLRVRQKMVGHRAPGGGPGGRVWPCGEALVHWLGAQRAATHNLLVQAVAFGPLDSVLELGCGTGVVSIALSVLGTSRVTATDGDPPSCELCEQNARESGATVRVCPFVWGSTKDLADTLELVDRDGQCASWVIGADLIYNAASAAALELTLRSLIAKGGCSLVIIAWVARGQNEEQFLWRLRDLGNVTTVERFSHARFGYLTKKSGRLVDDSLEFGVTVLLVHEWVTAGLTHGGALSRFRQQFGLYLARCGVVAHSGAPCCPRKPSLPAQWSQKKKTITGILL